jgi:hypothetical protein
MGENQGCKEKSGGSVKVHFPEPGKGYPVTVTWRPSIGFNLRVGAATKRKWAQFNHFRNWKERNGHPIRYYDVHAQVENSILRAEVNRLHTIIGKLGMLISLDRESEK